MALPPKAAGQLSGPYYLKGGTAQAYLQPGVVAPEREQGAVIQQAVENLAKANAQAKAQAKALSAAEKLHKAEAQLQKKIDKLEATYGDSLAT